MKVRKRLDMSQVRVLSQYLHTIGIALGEHPGATLDLDLDIDEKTQTIIGWQPSMVTAQPIAKPSGMADDSWLNEEPEKGKSAGASYDGPKGLEKR